MTFFYPQGHESDGLIHKESYFRPMSKLIAIGGVSRSGKSSLALKLLAALPDSIVLHQDDFVKSGDQIPQINGRTDWEHPDSIDWSLWKESTDKALAKHNHIIIEGLFVFYDASINSQIHRAIYLSIDQATFLERRRKETRWGHEPDWFIEHVWKAHWQYGLAPEELKALKIYQPSDQEIKAIIMTLD
ncbi:MAG: nicotinamide/nicotinate riboside kinase [Roseivirga sp.]|jgi:nicotinamide/nicotinate riboside kinase